MRKELRLLGALGLVVGCHAYDQGLLTAASSGPSASVSDPSSAANSGSGSGDAPAMSGDLVTADEEPLATTGEAGTGAAGSSVSAADGGAGGIAQAPHGGEVGGAGTGAAGAAAGAAGAGEVAQSAGTGGVSAPSAAGSAAAADGGNASAGSGGGAGAPSAGVGGAAADPATACALRGGQLWEVNQHCYFALDSSDSWNVSRDHCANLGASLIAITSAAEQAFASTLVGSSARWIGFARFGRPDFTWQSGEPVDYTNFEDGDSAVSGDAAVLIRSDTLLWSVADIAAPHAALCEWQ